MLLSNAFRVALVCRLGRIRERVGYDRDSRGWLLTDRVPVPREADVSFTITPALDYYLTLAERLGCDVSDRSMELAVEPDAAAEAEALFAAAGIDPSRPVVIINPGASFGSSKLWMPDRFASVANALIDTRGAQIILNAAPSEKAIAKAVADAMTHAPAVNFAERDNTLALLKAITARAALMITAVARLRCGEHGRDLTRQEGPHVSPFPGRRSQAAGTVTDRGPSPSTESSRSVRICFIRSMV